MGKPIEQIFNLNGSAFGNLQSRAGFPSRLRELIGQGAAKITMTVTARTAANMADDIAFAVSRRPLGVAQDTSPGIDVEMTSEEAEIVMEAMRRDAEALLARRVIDGMFENVKKEGQNVFTAAEVRDAHARGKMMIAIADRLQAAAGTGKV